jgi:hypothetical protein
MLRRFGIVISPSSGDSSPTIMRNTRGLARAVRADEPGFLARIELERGLDEQDLAAVLLETLVRAIMGRRY